MHFYEVAIALALIASALLCVLSTSRLLSVLALGMAGFMTTLVFMIYSAPDVAKTLLLVETLMVVFVVLLMRHMPDLSTVARHSVPRRTLNAVIASVIGASVTLILLNITAHPIDTTLSDYFARQSVPAVMAAISSMSFWSIFVPLIPWEKLLWSSWLALSLLAFCPNEPSNHRRFIL